MSIASRLGIKSLPGSVVEVTVFFLLTAAYVALGINFPGTVLTVSLLASVALVMFLAVRGREPDDTGTAPSPASSGPDWGAIGAAAVWTVCAVAALIVAIAADFSTAVCSVFLLVLWLLGVLVYWVPSDEEAVNDSEVRALGLVMGVALLVGAAILFGLWRSHTG